MKTEFFDRKGRLIRVGDLVRSPHYRDRRWGQQWLYHSIVANGEYLEAVPTEELATGVKDGGRVWINAISASTVEIIKGAGKYPDNVFQERKSNKKAIAKFRREVAAKTGKGN